MDGGIDKGVRYGEQVGGLPPGVLLRLRRAYAVAAPIRAAGASLTARLALGGVRFRDADPAVQRANAAFITLVSTLWDCPQMRSGFVKGWQAAVNALRDAEPAQAWRKLRGPIGVSFVQLERVGVTWPKPFTIAVLGEEVDIMAVPPCRLRSC